MIRVCPINNFFIFFLIIILKFLNFLFSFFKSSYLNSEKINSYLTNKTSPFKKIITGHSL